MCDTSGMFSTGSYLSLCSWANYNKQRKLGTRRVDEQGPWTRLAGSHPGERYCIATGAQTHTHTHTYMYIHTECEKIEDWVPCLHLDLLHQLHDVIGQVFLVRHGVATDFPLFAVAGVADADGCPVTHPTLLQHKTGLQWFKHYRAVYCSFCNYCAKYKWNRSKNNQVLVVSKGRVNDMQ